MSDVYFSKKIEKILEKIDFSKLGKNVAIKVHFGEKSCTTYLDPELVRKVYDYLKSKGKNPVLVECNVLYKGSRTDSTSHIKIAREHGFDMDIDILDGEHGQEYIDVQGCKLGKGLKKYDSLIVLSHFKGHIAAGFGGAIKNISMGLGSRAGKLDMHANVHPQISEQCIACGVCVEHCNANAIDIGSGKAEIDKEKCEGCAMCIAVCPQGAVMVPWGAKTAEQLQKRMCDYGKAVLSIFPQPIFINVLEKITAECDCMGTAQKPMMEDVGILYSSDMVSIDKASLDLANKHSHGNFSKVNRINKDKQIELAEKIGLGKSDYKMIIL